MNAIEEVEVALVPALQIRVAIMALMQTDGRCTMVLL
jgi:hypothetical protein